MFTLYNCPSRNTQISQNHKPGFPLTSHVYCTQSLLIQSSLYVAFLKHGLSCNSNWCIEQTNTKGFLKWWPKKSLTVKVSDSQSRDSGVEANWVPPIAPSLWIKVPVMEKVYVCCMGLECVGGASTPQTQILPFTFALKDRQAQNSDCISVLHFFDVLNLLKVSCLSTLTNVHHSISQQLVHPQLDK